ncbi:hypothetical protein TNCV_3942281 [Trichonephila clavipes]|nr:hypothetical protein TNCV_3942281 [Trichonephila clavipes]
MVQPGVSTGRERAKLTYPNIVEVLVRRVSEVLLQDNALGHLRVRSHGHEKRVVEVENSGEKSSGCRPILSALKRAIGTTGQLPQKKLMRG